LAPQIRRRSLRFFNAKLEAQHRDKALSASEAQLFLDMLPVRLLHSGA
jgi:hypothetical protein